MSIINNDLTLDVTKTIQHAEMIIDQGCHGAAIFGSTGQAQLISITEKIKLFNQLSTSKYKDKYIIGTGLNSLSETINLMSVARSLNFKKFLIFNYFFSPCPSRPFEALFKKHNVENLWVLCKTMRCKTLLCCSSLKGKLSSSLC